MATVGVKGVKGLLDTCDWCCRTKACVIIMLWKTQTH